jgi:hypothetical protein
MPFLEESMYVCLAAGRSHVGVQRLLLICLHLKPDNDGLDRAARHTRSPNSGGISAVPCRSPMITNFLESSPKTNSAPGTSRHCEAEAVTPKASVMAEKATEPSIKSPVGQLMACGASLSHGFWVGKASDCECPEWVESGHTSRRVWGHGRWHPAA